MSPRCHIVDPIDRDDGGSINAEDLVLNFKKDMANLSKIERRRAIESVRDVIRAAAFDDAVGFAYEVDCCPRCSSVVIVKKGKFGNGGQRCLCRDCGRTFSGSTDRILGTSRLPRETWTAYAECFVLILPLRGCATRCRVCLKTACTMRHRLIVCLLAYSSWFRAGRGCGCELDETYFPESFKGNHRRARSRYRAPSRHRGKQARRRGLSLERICVMTVSGMRGAVFAMTIASRSSVLASPAKRLAALCAASPGRYTADIPAALARPSARAHYVARLVDDHECVGEAAERRVQVAFLVRDGGAQLYLAVPGRDACPMGRYPDIEPDDGFRHSRWRHGGILQSVGRSGPPATPILSGRGACARQFPISRPERRASPVATPPPGPSTGQGQTAIRRRPIGGPSKLARIVGNAPNARHRNLSMAYFRL